MKYAARIPVCLIAFAMASVPTGRAHAQDAAADSSAFSMSAEELAAYTGDYELAPGFVLTISTSEGRIFGQATGQGQAEIFPRKTDEFYYKIVDAQLSFKRNEDGVINSLVLHQGGRDIPAKKIK